MQAVAALKFSNDLDHNAHTFRCCLRCLWSNLSGYCTLVVDNLLRTSCPNLSQANFYPRRIHMWEYIQNTKTRVVHSAGGCEDAREFGQGRGWRRLGSYLLEIAAIESYLNLEIAAIESPGPGGG